MTPQQLDVIFPWFVFAYGAFVTVVLGSERLTKLGENRMPADAWGRLVGHRHLALLCLAVGALWILQDLVFA